MHHWLRDERRNLHAHFSARAQPAIVVEPGDTVSFSVPDVSWGLEPPTSTTAPRAKVEPRDQVRDNGPCLCGPVAVRGAEPGDMLEIVIEHVRPGPWGWTYAGKGLASAEHNAALGIGDAPLTLVRWSFDEQRCMATSHLGHTVPIRPFAGTIGLAPNEAHSDGWTPRACGGNMDCRHLTAGSVLFLPVMASGGLLSAGDGHAAQGDGELSGTAIECPLEELRVRVMLHKSRVIAGPRIRTADAWITLGFGASLDVAATQAAASMLDILEEQLRLPRAEALALASSRVHLHVTQMVNPLRGVHAMLPDQPLP